MIGGIIVSHGKLAEEILNALTIILGEALNIEAMSKKSQPEERCGDFYRYVWRNSLQFEL
jgi:mannose/fructose-specific phosphotransferase system component IIA